MIDKMAFKPRNSRNLNTILILRDIQQRKLRLSPFEQHGMAFPLVVAEGDILTVDVPVASLQLLD